MLAILCAVACVAAADGIMIKNARGEGACNSAASAWKFLDEQFSKLPYNHYHCHDCEKLAGMGDLRLEDMKLPSNSVLLFYGHSFLREVYENLIIANLHLLTKRERLTWENWEEEPFEEGKFFAGCKAKSEGLSQGFPKFEETKLANAISTYVDGDTGVYRFESLNTTVFTVINYAPLQNPSCMAELDSFLNRFSFDSIIFMRPHGDSFDQWIAAKRAGVDIKTLDSPVDLSKMTPTKGAVVEYSVLAAKFKQHTPFTVFVEPWTLYRNRTCPGREDAIAHADESLILSNYVFSDGGSLCSAPSCKQPKDARSEFHQCQPGSLTIAARDLISMLRRRPLARG
eukprot:TRINITY_DN4515_c0_g1_i1.p1 TRINITY_DN4515_c0_g1~~TRINITY_DN4515_c0_g1_i1.p1  ORF type:complete len:342 (+),score=39.34 TRINITY_DN4515_c0_g1_i1:57-1082(+)